MPGATVVVTLVQRKKLFSAMWFLPNFGSNFDVTALQMIKNDQARQDVSNDVRMSAQLASVGALRRSRRKGVFPLFLFVAFLR